MFHVKHLKHVVSYKLDIFMEALYSLTNFWYQLCDLIWIMKNENLIKKVSVQLSSVLITGQGNLQGAVNHDVHYSSESISFWDSSSS